MVLNKFFDSTWKVSTFAPMKSVSIIGSGRSSVFLIEYLFKYCQQNNLPFAVYDKDFSFIHKALPSSMHQCLKTLDINDADALNQLVESSQLVVSMLPAFMHPVVANLCLKHKVQLATASYISDALLAMKQDVESAGLIFMNEVGLDPGIDHMSAMKIMDDLRDKGAIIKGFKSYCGGLVADEDDGDNPWKYKFSWNPRNVVLAAQGAPALFLENGKMKIMPYQQIFQNAEPCYIHDYGWLEAYPNRDSLKYTDLYDLHDVDDMMRGTFRKSGYCKAWQVFVSLGMTDDALVLHLPKDCSMLNWLEMYLPEGQKSPEQRLKEFLNLEDAEIEKLRWLGFFSENTMPLNIGTSAQILEKILVDKWVLGEHDRDLVVMQHQIRYALNHKDFIHESTMVLKGDSNTHTAMAKTVGLPLAICCKLMLEKSIKRTGVLSPVSKDIYEPILNELSTFGVHFKDVVKALS